MRGGGDYLEIVKISEYLKGTNFKPIGRITVAAYYRFFIPKVLSQYEKVLYVDCDVLFNGDVSSIFDMDLFAEENVLGVNKMIYQLAYICDYFNSGVLLFNVKQYLKENICEQCLEHMKTRKEDVDLFDEAVLNDVCCGKVKNFYFIYNYQTFYLQFKQCIEITKIKSIKDIVIIHYSAKPWQTSSTPLGNLWWKTVKKMPKDIKKEIYEKYGQYQKQNDLYYYKYYFASPLGKFIYKIKKKFKKNK